MGSIPLPALDIKPPENPLDQYGKALSLQETIQRQKLLPGEMQAQQQALQSGGLDLQLKQMQVNNAKIGQAALSDPNFSKDFENWQQQKTQPTQGTTPANGSVSNANVTGKAPAVSSIPLHPVAQFLAETKGLPLMGPGGAMDISNQLLAGTSKLAEIAKTQGEAGTSALTNYTKQHENFDNIAEPILAEKDPAKQAAGLATLQSEIAAHPDMYPPEATQHLDKINSVQALQAAANTSTLKQKMIEDATKQSQASTAATTAKEGELKTAAPSSDELNTFTKQTLPSFTTLMPAQRAAYAAQALQAKTHDEFEKVVAQADATEKAMQLHKDSLANSLAIAGNKFGEAGLTANEKLWTDPQRGYAGALAQANQTRNSIKAGADGNALLTAMVPTMEVLGVNHAAGISRISPQEAIAAGTSPDWATRWNAWATKAATGKLTPELAKEGNELMNVVQDAAYGKAVQSATLTAKGHGLEESQVPAMDRDGNLTTLDKVAGAAKGGGPASSAAPATDPFAQFGGKRH